MGKVDLYALRKKHEALQSGKTGGGGQDFLKNFVQLEEGTTTLRILPPKGENDPLFYAETKIHRIGEGENVKNFHCRKVHNEKCPLCDAYYKLWDYSKKTGKDGKDQYATLARLIKPRERYYLNVAVRPANEVKILSIGQIVFKKILNTMMDPDYGDITDLKTGYDFKIVKEMDGGFPKYDQSSPRPKSSPAGTGQEIAAFMESLHDIHSLVKLEDFEEMRKSAEILLTEIGISTTNHTPKIMSSDDEDGPETNYLNKLKG